MHTVPQTERSTTEAENSDGAETQGSQFSMGSINEIDREEAMAAMVDDMRWATHTPEQISVIRKHQEHSWQDLQRERAWEAKLST